MNGKIGNPNGTNLLLKYDESYHASVFESIVEVGNTCFNHSTTTDIDTIQAVWLPNLPFQKCTCAIQL